MLNLTGKRVLVSGGSRGIGKAIVEEFHSAGARVFFGARSFEDLQRLKSTLGKDADCFSFDATEPKSIREFIEKGSEFLGGIDVVVANVGSGQSVAPGEETAQEWETCFQKNFFSTTSLAIEAQKHIQNSQGVFIAISSICGVETIPNAPLTYSSAKAALNHFISGYSRYLGKFGARAVAVAPGNILFEGSTWESKIKEDSSRVESMLDREVALKKFGTPKDIADACLYLAANSAKFISGTVLVVDGGQTRS